MCYPQLLYRLGSKGACRTAALSSSRIKRSPHTQRILGGALRSMPRVTGASAWGKPRRRARASFWHQRPQRRPSFPNVVLSLEEPSWSSPALNEAREQRSKEPKADLARAKLLGRATRLWACNYTIPLEHELKEHPDLVANVVDMYAAQTSTYRMRLTDDRLKARYDAKTQFCVRDTVAVMRRRRNQFDIPFSVDARSLSYFNQRIATRVWRDNQKGLRIIHRDGCKTLLDAMIEVEPKPPFLLNQFVSVFGVDQCNV